MVNPLQQAGSQGDKPPRYVPLYTSRFFTGLWTQRNPLSDPGTRADSLYYGGRPDALISGANVELTNLLTLSRRPGTSAYSLQTVSEAINSFYSFKTFTTLTETIQVIMDGLTQIYTLTPAAVTSFFTKGPGAIATSFLGINNTLYFGDAVEERAYKSSPPTGYSATAHISATALTSNIATYTVDKSFHAGDIVTVTGTSNDGGTFNITGQTILSATATQFTVAITGADFPEAGDSGTAAVIGATRKWGIANGGITLTSEYAGLGVSGFASFIPGDQGPSSPGTAVDSALPPSFYPWSNASNVEVLDGQFANSNIIAVQGLTLLQGESTYLNATNFGFSVPAGATITGVAATIYKQETSTSDAIYGGGITDDNIYLVTGGTIQTGGTNHAAAGNWSTDFVTSTDYGSSSDTWATVLTPAIVNGSDFGIAMRAASNVTTLNPFTNANFVEASIDYVSMTVYYTIPTDPSWTNATNVEGPPDATYTTAIPTNDIQTAPLFCSNYGFTVDATIVGVVVSVTGHVSAGAADTTLFVQLQDNNGNAFGVKKSLPLTSTTDVTTSFGSSTDLWGGPINSVVVNGGFVDITNTALTSNVATYTADNTFVIGQIVTVTGTANGGGVYNVTRQPVVTATPTTFTIAIIHGNVVSGADTGTAGGGSYQFGAQVIVSGSGQTFSIDSCEIQLFTSAIVTRVSSSSGTFSATDGYVYAYAYANTTVSPPVFSNTTARSVSTGSFTNKLNVEIDVVASLDPQVNAIWLFRTADGGAVLESLPTNPYPNTTTTIFDNAADETLNEFQLPALAGENTPPPSGIAGMVFHMGRLWGFVNNVLYYATGPDLGNILGNPYESWGPANVFTLPSAITKVISTTVGLLVFTISDTYIVYGTGSATAAASGVSGITVFYVAPFITGIGLLNQFAADVNGTTIYMHSTDGQVLSLDPSSGISEIGFPIGNPNIAYPTDPSLASFNPATSHVTWHVSGSADKALYVADGSTGWFRCNTSQAPEGGFVWSPKATIVGGCDAVFSIETSPGVHQLLIGPTTGGGPILYRNLNVYSDNNTTYPAEFVMGSIVLAYPGQLAELGFITCDFYRQGGSPTVEVLLNEISGPADFWFDISGYVHSDPPSLYGVSGSPHTLYSNRYDFGQNNAFDGSGPPPIYCRHLQVAVDFGNDGVKNEMLTFTIYGATWDEA